MNNLLKSYLIIVAVSLTGLSLLLSGIQYRETKNKNNKKVKHVLKDKKSVNADLKTAIRSSYDFAINKKK